MDDYDEMYVVLWIEEVFRKELNIPEDEQFMSKDDIYEILDDNPEICDESVRKSIFGYPTRPLYREIGTRLKEWMETGYCSSENLPSYPLLDEKDYNIVRQKKFSEITPLLKRIKSLFSLWSEDERIYSFRDILQRLGKRGILDLLGMRKTVGSRLNFPPPRKTLVETFCSKYQSTSASVLTQGGRAFTKHSHRDRSETWWGTCTGSEQNKNDHAFKKMTQILDNATWLNIHDLPGDLPTIEARQENGYGVRWTCSGSEFRGFLEPQMVDGHEVGWKH